MLKHPPQPHLSSRIPDNLRESRGRDENPVKVLLWDVAAGKVIRSVEATQRVTSVAFAPGGKLFASSVQQKSICIWAVPG